MSYLVTSWTRCAAGEESIRTIRVRHFGDTSKALSSLLAGNYGICRVTLSSSTSAAMWDLHRGSDRDFQLDSSMRNLAQTSGVIEGPKLDVAAGITQAQLERAVEELVTRPGEL